MIKSEKKLKELVLLLNKDNKILISQAIESLRDERPFEGVIGLLISIYDKSDDHSIRNTIMLFMNDIKDESARPEVMAEIKKQWNSATISMLVSSCWQSGLDYSDYYTDFLEVFLSNDYVTAIECLTVISDSAKNITRAEKDKIIRKIADNPLPVVDEKSALTLELISILEK